MAENKIEKTRQIYLNREVSTVFDDENFYAHNKTVRLSNIIVSLDLFFTAIPGFELTNIERDGKEIDAKNFLSEEAFDDADENEKYLFKNAILTHQIDLTGFKCEVQSHSDSDGTPIQIFVWVDMTENDLSVLIQKFKEARDSVEFDLLAEYDECFGGGNAYKDESEWQATQTERFENLDSETPQLIAEYQFAEYR